MLITRLSEPSREVAKEVSIRVRVEMSRMVIFEDLVLCFSKIKKIKTERGMVTNLLVSPETNIQRRSRSRPRFVRKECLIEMPRQDFMAREEVSICFFENVSGMREGRI